MIDSIDLQTIAYEIKRAQDEALRIEPVTLRFKGFDVASAYQVAHLVHEARLQDGYISIGRKSVSLTRACGMCMVSVSQSGPMSMTPQLLRFPVQVQIAISVALSSPR